MRSDLSEYYWYVQKGMKNHIWVIWTHKLFSNCPNLQIILRYLLCISYVLCPLWISTYAEHMKIINFQQNAQKKIASVLITQFCESNSTNNMYLTFIHFWEKSLNRSTLFLKSSQYFAYIDSLSSPNNDVINNYFKWQLPFFSYFSGTPSY
jgi:hypothetical protein